VQRLLLEGKTVAETARILRLNRSTVCYHKRRLGLPMNSDCRRRYDWSEVQTYSDEGHTVEDCCIHFGFARKSWFDAVQRGAVIPRPQAIPLEALLVAGPRRSRWNLKQRLLAAGLKKNRCETCGISEWRDEALSLQLHHRNGDGLDNRLENLMLLCPNCHSQTPTWGAKKRAA
jgi:5-methylcytosine-specific restriction endonuclease McrA